ncbi:tumor necrosis factor receptor superfamily member 8 [Dasypus novemcinctus]|uniref:tumor necrosis factor receptor superfamily member 8 n=1 Tax=Dasypus novemcinctus TaxID=9361 RepID=UPI00265EAB26|nr:tumor necrosis factor receptor superfamily member 8 [Dasypus novemcinctus]
MFCSTSATNSCARCSKHSTCLKGMIVKLQGTAERDTICEQPPPKSPDCSTSREDCEAPASTSTPQVVSTLTSPATSGARTMLPGEGAALSPKDASESMGAPGPPSSMEKPSPGPGLSPQLCPQGSAACRKQCPQDYYLDMTGRCIACVSCSRDDLVEKMPCTWNSSRVCECRPGMFCATSATNSCARCITRSICPPGVTIKPPGSAERDTTQEPGETTPDCSTSPENSRAPASSTPTSISIRDSQTSRIIGSTSPAQGDAPIPTSAPISLSSTGKPLLDPGPVLLWVLLVLLLAGASVAFFLSPWRACRKGIRQKLHLCYPAQTLRPALVPADSRPRRSPTPARRSVLVAAQNTEELALLNPPAMETCANTGAACLESLSLLNASPGGGPEPSRDLPEPRVTAEHTNNKIEKIYIMKADTVIVGTVRTEVPEDRGLAVPAGPEFEEDLEVDRAPRYPEQETEPPLGSSGDVMFSVEEEGKEDHWPTTASEK